ncbi:hypothetical protein B0H11DRAFT_655511 [Mycena galericulata]|nr:hypothetical protein B0H11DRAFT_655511 [Mycena galericulata]
MSFSASTLLASILSPKGGGPSLVKAFIAGAHLSYLLVSTIAPSSPNASMTMDRVFLPTKTTLDPQEAPLSFPIVLGFVAAIGCVVSVIMTHKLASSKAASDDEQGSSSGSNDLYLKSPDGPSGNGPNGDRDGDDGDEAPEPGEADHVQAHILHHHRIANGEEPPPPPPPPVVSTADRLRKLLFSWKFTLLLLAITVVVVMASRYYQASRPKTWSDWFARRAAEAAFILAVDSTFILILHHLFSLIHGLKFLVSCVKRIRFGSDCIILALIIGPTLYFQRNALWSLLHALLAPFAWFSSEAWSRFLVSGAALRTSCLVTLVLTTVGIFWFPVLRRWVMDFNKTKIVPAIALLVLLYYTL